ncbi:hypothetical protein DFS34DRAFT_639433 [Phlyctochytrium arcticum]|nr:hypothetical protein DFS34DRAFT_639433 [Phlyctochytrium arcticum]
MVSLTVLTNKEEEMVFNNLKKNATTKCAKYLEDLATCTRSKTLTVYWACQSEKRILNDCLSQYTTEDHRDVLRKEMVEKKKAYLAANPHAARQQPQSS